MHTEFLVHHIIRHALVGSAIALAACGDTAPDQTERIENASAAVELALAPRSVFFQLYEYAAQSTGSVSVQFGEARTHAFQDVASWKLGQLLETDGSRVLHPGTVHVIGGLPAVSVSIDESTQNAERMKKTLLATLEDNGIQTDGLDEVQVIRTSWTIAGQTYGSALAILTNASHTKAAVVDPFASRWLVEISRLADEHAGFAVGGGAAAGEAAGIVSADGMPTCNGFATPYGPTEFVRPRKIVMSDQQHKTGLHQFAGTPVFTCKGWADDLVGINGKFKNLSCTDQGQVLAISNNQYKHVTTIKHKTDSGWVYNCHTVSLQIDIDCEVKLELAGSVEVLDTVVGLFGLVRKVFGSSPIEKINRLSGLPIGEVIETMQLRDVFTCN